MTNLIKLGVSTMLITMVVIWPPQVVKARIDFPVRIKMEAKVRDNIRSYDIMDSIKIELIRINSINRAISKNYCALKQQQKLLENIK